MAQDITERKRMEEALRTIQFETAEGHGTTFIIRLPLEAPLAQEGERLHEKTHSLG